MFGGELLSEDGKTCLLSDPGSMQALKWLYDSKPRTKSIPASVVIRCARTLSLARLAHYNTPVWSLNSSKVTDWAFEGMSPQPLCGPDGTRGSQVSGAGFCMTRPPRKSTHKRPSRSCNSSRPRKMVSNMSSVAQVALAPATTCGMIPSSMASTTSMAPLQSLP